MRVEDDTESETFIVFDREAERLKKPANLMMKKSIDVRIQYSIHKFLYLKNHLKKTLNIYLGANTFLLIIKVPTKFSF